MPVKIFFCYAREDELLLNQLKRHLRPLQRQGLIDIWYDRDISAGGEWEREIDTHINAAQIILLLVSPDFMESDYCYSIEMKRAMERQERKEARVIPVILRHVYWQVEPLCKLQALPIDAKPVKSWVDPDEAFFIVAEGIRSIVEILIGHRAEEGQSRQTEDEFSGKDIEKQARPVTKVRARKAREKKAQEDPANRQTMKDLEDLIKAADLDDIVFHDFELKLSDTWEIFISHLAAKFVTIEHIREDPNRESSFYCSGSPGALSYDIIVSGVRRGIPFTRHIDVINYWLHPLAIQAAGQDAGIPWDTGLWPVKNESDEEMRIEDPLAECRDCTYWVLFKQLKSAVLGE